MKLDVNKLTTEWAIAVVDDLKSAGIQWTFMIKTHLDKKCSIEKLAEGKLLKR